MSGVIWKPKSEYTPTVTSRSWTIAMNAAAGHLGLEADADVRDHRDEEDDQRLDRLVGDLTAPRRADARSWRPGSATLPASLAMASATLLVSCALGRRAQRVDVGRDLVGLRAEFLDDRDRCRPASSTALVMLATDVCGASTSHELPPLKSMPKLKPRIAKRRDAEHDDGDRDAEPDLACVRRSRPW